MYEQKHNLNLLSRSGLQRLHKNRETLTVTPSLSDTPSKADLIFSSDKQIPVIVRKKNVFLRLLEYLLLKRNT